MDARTREQLEWLAEEVVEAGGEATIWFAEPGSAAHERALAQQMADLAQADYEAIIAEANAATTSEAGRRRTLARLRREQLRIRSRDYFPSGFADQAHAAIEALAQRPEVAS
jgi:hypothetical protein